jgi:hypothetical protein
VVSFSHGYPLTPRVGSKCLHDRKLALGRKRRDGLTELAQGCYKP